jgi:hypothetical protein
MRNIVLGLCMFAAACSGRGADSPLAASASTGQASTEASNGTDLPISGSFTRTSHAVDTPPILTISGIQEGTASHLGRFTATSVDVVNETNNTATGTLYFTAANGDRLLTTTIGAENSFTPPNISHVTSTATIVGGTGRFAGATGSLTIKFDETIDFATATATGSGSFEGRINLSK